MKKVSMALLAATIFAITFGSCKKSDAPDPASNPGKTGTTKVDEVVDSEEEVRVALAAGMVSFKNSLAGEYAASTSYEEFRRIIFGTADHEMSDEAEALLNGAYLLLEAKVPDDFIIANYSGKEMAPAALFLEAHEGSDGAAFFNYTPSETATTLGCKWYQVGCHINKIGEWFKRNKDTIAAIGSAVSTVVTLIKLFQD